MKCSDVEWTDVFYVKWFCFKVKWNALKWSVVMWSELTWFMWIDFFEVKWNEVKWSGAMVKSSGTKVPCTLGWPYTEGTWLYLWLFHLVYILYCGCFNLFFNVWGSVCVGMFWQLCGCFGNMCPCIYCVLYYLYCVFVLFLSHIFILICFVCTSVRTTATEWKLNYSN